MEYYTKVSQCRTWKSRVFQKFSKMHNYWIDWKNNIIVSLKHAARLSSTSLSHLREWKETNAEREVENERKKERKQNQKE